MYKQVALLSAIFFLSIVFNVKASSVSNFTYRVQIESNFKKEFEEKFEKQISSLLTSKLKPFFSSNELSSLRVNVIVTNEFLRDIIAQDENGKSLLYVSPLMLMSNDLERLLAHEIFHLLHFKIKREESWLSEGLANFIPYILYGKFNRTEVDSVFMQSTVSLLDDFSLSENSHELYGVTTLFIKYAFDHCGGKEFFYNIIHSKSSGENAVTDALHKTKSTKKICEDFSSLARAFTLARVINKRNFTAKEEFLLLDSSYELPVNFSLAESMRKFSAKDKASFMSQIPRYLPILLPLDMKNFFLGQKNIKVFEISRSYPVYARELGVGDSISSEFLVLFKE